MQYDWLRHASCSSCALPCCFGLCRRLWQPCCTESTILQYRAYDKAHVFICLVEIWFDVYSRKVWKMPKLATASWKGATAFVFVCYPSSTSRVYEWALWRLYNQIDRGILRITNSRCLTRHLSRVNTTFYLSSDNFQTYSEPMNPPIPLSKLLAPSHPDHPTNDKLL